MKLKRLKAVEVIASLSIQYSGASISQQVAERRVVLSDEAFWLILLLASWVVSLAGRALETVRGWRRDFMAGVATITSWLLPVEVATG